MSSPPESTKSPGRLPAAPCLRFFEPLSLYLDHNSRDMDKWMVSERQFPDGEREWSITPTPYPMREKAPSTRTTCERERVGARAGAAVTPSSSETREKNDRRAARKLKRLIRYQDLCTMVTLSFPGEGIHDYEESYRLVSRFIHDHGELVHRGGAYAAVPEWHPGGHGSHWHPMTGGGRFKRSELTALRVGWTDFLKRQGYEPSGGAKWIRVHVRVFGSPRKAANYAAKYVTKSLGEGMEIGRQRYLRSEGFTIPEPERSYSRSLATAFILLPHPLFWDQMYSGFGKSEPWVWVNMGPPD